MMIDSEKLTRTNVLFSLPIWEMNFIHHNDCRESFIGDVYDTMVRNPNDVKKSSLNGYQSDDISRNPIFEPLHAFIMQQLRYVLEDCKISNCVAEIKRSWFNVNSKNSMNLLHTHTTTFSGVYYLKSNKNSGKVCFLNLSMLNSWNGYNLSDEKNNFVADTFCIDPVEGRIFIWQSPIPHYVTPNNDDEDRISISFNIEVQKDVLRDVRGNPL